MNRFVGNPFVWACCVAMMLWTHLSWAELSATADRRTIAMGETLRLTLLGDAGEQPAEIDLTPLNRDWEILSRSSATNARFINGQNQVTRTLEMELAPLREGTLTIPSLTAGGRSTTPLAIRVNPEPVVAPGDELVLFEVVPHRLDDLAAKFKRRLHATSTKIEVAMLQAKIFTGHLWLAR